jgi:hypothetical protein
MRFAVQFSAAACITWAVSVATFLNHGAWAQTNTATLSGTVTDQSTAVLPGATVTVRNVETGARRLLVTGNEGLYHAAELSPGNYEVEAQLSGFKTAVRTGISLSVGRQAIVDLVLEVGEVQQSVVVTGEAPLVESRTAAVSVLIDERTVRELPLNGRDLNQLSLLTPGVALSSSSTAKSTAGFGKMLSVKGSRPQSNVFVLDGTDINAFPGGSPASSAGVQLGVESILEFRIFSDPFSAEYGRAAGGVVSYVSRGGGNEFHGSLYEFLRNNALDAKNFFDLHEEPIPPFKRNQFGGSFGGPLRKDRTFFFGNYEALIERLGLSLVANVLTPAVHQGIPPTGGTVTINPAIQPYLDLYPLPNGRDFGDGRAEYFSSPSKTTDEHYGVARIDHRFSDRHSLFGRYTIDHADVDSPDSIGTVSTLLNRSRTQYVTLQETALLSPTTINALTLAYNRSTIEEFNSPIIDISGLLFVPEKPDALFSIGAGSGTTGLTGNTFRHFVTNTFQLKDDLNLPRGKHMLKFGANLERLQFNENADLSAGGSYSFQTIRDFLIGSARSFSTTLPDSDAIRTANQMLAGFFVQDEWSVHPGVTLNLGLRYEFISVPTERWGRIAQFRHYNPDLRPSDIETGGPLFENPSLKSFAPRLGISWDPLGQGQLVVRAGAGIFHEQIMSHYLTHAFDRMPPFFQTASLTAPLDTVPFPNWRNGNPQALARPGLDGFTFLPEQPYVLRYNFELQRPISANSVLSAGYTGARGVHLVRHAALDTEVFTFRDGKLFFPAPPVRLYPNFNSIRIKFTDGVSDYHGVTLSLNQRLSNGLQLQSSYTFSKSTDTGAAVSGNSDFTSDNNMSRSPVGKDPGLAAFDITHNLTISSMYDLPFGPNSALGSAVGGITSHLISGWQVGGILRMHTGLPFSAYLGFVPAANFVTGTANRSYFPDLAPGASANPVLGGPDRYFDPASFLVPPAGFLGNLGRNTLRSPGSVNLDFSLVKNTRLGEGKGLQFKAEFFNLPNRPNFGIPTNSVFNTNGTVRSDAGRINDTVGTSRQVQLGLKLTF